MSGSSSTTKMRWAGSAVNTTRHPPGPRRARGRTPLAALAAARPAVGLAPVPPPPPLPPSAPGPGPAPLFVPSGGAPVPVGGGDATSRYVSPNAAFFFAAPPLSQRDSPLLRVLAIN